MKTLVAVERESLSLRAKAEKFKNNKIVKKEIGITLVALIVTIIILMILVGVVIATVTGNNGILGKSKLAREIYRNSANEENSILSKYENEIDKTAIDVASSRGDTVILTSQQYNSLIQRIENLEKNNVSIKDVDLDYDNKVGIEAYKSSNNKYVVPSNGIIAVELHADSGGGAYVNINGINFHVSGNNRGASTEGSYSQIVTKGNVIYFGCDYDHAYSFGNAYFIPFK